MAKPSNKSPAINAFLDETSQQLFGVKRSETIGSNQCVTCNGPAVAFKDTLSERKYTISGMCQKCQDGVFGETL